MSIQTESSHSPAHNALVAVTRALHHRHLVLIPTCLVLADRLVTAAYWQHEANPVVTALGLDRWLMLTAGLLIGWPVAWYGLDARQVWLMYPLLWLFTLLQGLAVVTNVAVVGGLLG
jgi:hypothetical protein